MHVRTMATALGWREEENKNSGPKWNFVDSWPKNKLIHTICKYPGCAFYHVLPWIASREVAKSLPVDCFVLLGTSDLISADISVREHRNRNRACSIYKTIFNGLKYPKMILFNFEDTMTGTYVKPNIWKGSSLNCGSWLLAGGPLSLRSLPLNIYVVLHKHRVITLNIMYTHTIHVVYI